ncbi:LysR family transcriptional regulator [Agreia pratensis]|uniref:DNA-binding transcriptional regulator, LysR family n=1 Tax=Agreia pratensis TaxID=150121 RepID=A0A1X7KKE4_9MICO|nr:LysR family transcriptional regulator [Agreia pratensis]SMG41141.1 DNA-binding transcriptional regulator, LysR family [Agreia pratensis]
MDVNQLALLRELAERGSVTEVAYALGKTPSAVSQQLRTLQRQMGTVLVERVGRGVRLTDAGHALAESSVRVATAIAEAEATWSAFQGGASGTVRMAIFYSAAELLVPGLLTRMRAHSGIALEISDRDVSQDDFAALTSDFDVVVAHRSDDVLPPDRERLSVVPLLREPLDVALPLDHHLATRSRVSPADVIGENWIGVPIDFPLDRVLQAMSAQAGTAARVVHRTTHLPLAEKLVAAGHGVALLPRNTSLERSPGRYALLPLTDLRAGRHIEVLMRPDRAARRAVGLVLDELVAEAQSASAEDSPSRNSEE